MWCPECKNEYIEGITRCADCKVALVPELTAEPKKPQTIVGDFDYAGKDAPASDENHVEKKATRVYVDKNAAYEDMKSTAYTFLLVGGAGIIFLILFGLGIISFNMAGYMKVLTMIVMGILFIAFFVIGIKYLQKLGTAQEAITSETDLTEEITNWFLASFLCSTQDEDSLSTEQLYFSRYEQMMQHLQTAYPELEEAYADHIIEILYEKVYSD